MEPAAGAVGLTPRAAQQLRRLRARHGELMFHQSGGCCDGSAPMCFAAGDFLTSDADVHLGDVVVEAEGEREGFSVPVWMSREQHVRWAHTRLTIDLVPGRGAGFSLEAPDGVRFLVRSHLAGAGTPGTSGTSGTADASRAVPPAAGPPPVASRG